MRYDRPVRVALVLCLLGAFAPINASAIEAVQFNRLSIEQGLSQSVVQAIVQDQRGFVWIGTQQGLNRFDGREFVTYFHDPADPDSLSHDWVWALHLDRRGTLWIGTDGGLNRLNPSAGDIQPVFSQLSNGFAEQPIRVIAEDKQGVLWLGSDGGGVIRYEPESGALHQFLHDPDDGRSLSSNRVKALHVDNNGFVWIGTDGGGLNRLDPVSQRFSRTALPGNDGRVRFITTDRTGDLWVATNERGLFRLDAAGMFKHHFTANSDGGLSSNAVRALLEDDRGTLWVGTDSHGLNRFDPSSNRFDVLGHQPSNIYSLNGDHVTALFQDRGGVIWVGTQVGANTWNPHVGGFSTIRQLGQGEGELSNNWIAGFAEAPDGRLYVATAGGGVNLVDLESGRAELVGPQAGPKALADNRVMALATTAEGVLWAGTRSGGLGRYDPVTDGWKTYRHDPDDPQSLSFDGVTSLLIDAGENLWVGTYGGGLGRFVPEIDGFENQRHDPANSASVCSDRILALYQDQQKDLWIGTHKDGLCRLDADSGTFEHYRHDPKDAWSLSSDEAWTLTEDAAGALWVGTADAGLSVWRFEDRQKGVVRFKRIGVAEGLPSNLVYGILSEPSGRMWVSGNRGLSSVELEAGAIRRFGIADGLQSNEFNLGATFRSADGRLFFGGVNGFNAFYPRNVQANTYAPDVVLTRFLRHNQPTNLDTLKDDDGLVTFRYTDRLITFEYAALDFTDPRGLSYRHRLDGFEEEWVDDGTRHSATYTNLAPGDYVLRVAAKNKDGVSSEEFQIPFRVLPALWSTWWARSGYLLVALLAGFFIYRSYARRLAFASEIHQINETLIREITARQYKEAELERTEQQAQQYLDVVEVMILALDKQGAILMINQKGTRVLGCSEEEIVGKDFYEEFVPLEFRDEVRKRFETVDQHGYSESPVRTRKGDERMMAWHTIELRETTTNPAGILISGEDISQMRSLEKQLRDAQKMESVGTLARGVAHDFNNILGSVLGYAELAMVAGNDAEKAAQHYRNLEKVVSKARLLVKRILSFDSNSGLNPSPVQVATVVRETLQLVEPTIPPHIRTECSLDGECLPVMADAVALEQVILNLCTNAVQAMAEDGGTLRLELAMCEIDVERARSTTTLSPGPHVLLSISDSGPGMDDSTMSRIFDPFYTTRRQTGGTGLGLAIVHGIVTQMQGWIQVLTEPGQGSRFEIYLPCCNLPVPVDRDSSTRSVSPGAGGTLSVLFVDDEPDLRAIAEEALSNLGYRVFTAGDGDGALAMFDRIGSDIDVVITDQTMPNMLGRELARELKKRRSDLPIILMSGADSRSSDSTEVFLAKPFSIESMARAVRSVLSSPTPS